MKNCNVSCHLPSRLTVALICGVVLSLAACGGSSEKGPRGNEGPAGHDGQKGIAGADGTAGSDGEVGAEGPQGQQGLQGNTGATGTTGTPGADYPGPLPAEYVAADGLAGGAAFSKWYEASGGGSGSTANYGVSVNAEFVRCKTCHAWDGKGNAASYADRTGLSTGTASRPDVSSVNLRAMAASNTPDEVFDLIASPYGRPLNAADNAHPDFTASLTNNQIWNLVKFMREEWVNPNELYSLSVTGAPMHYEYAAATTSWVLKKPVLTYTNIGTNGDAVRGKTIYTAKCAACHGANGNTVLLESNTMGVGEFVRAKPHEAWFKAKFGTNTASMLPGMVTSTTDLKDLYKAFTNTTDFPNYP